MALKQNFSLKSYNTFGVDVSTTKFFEFKEEEELISFVQNRKFTDDSIFILGGGSNVLFRKNFEGIVFHSKIDAIKVINEDDNSITLRVGSGLEWDKFVAHCVKNKFYGIENLSLIPGNVGAAPVQNIGAYGSEVNEVIEGVWCYDLKNREKRYLTNSECEFEYRKSVFKKKDCQNLLITYVDFKLNKIPPYKRKIQSFKGGMVIKYLRYFILIFRDLTKAIKSLKYNGKSKSFGIDYRILKNLMENLGFISIQKARQTIINKRNSKIPSPKEIGNVGSFFKNPIISKTKAKLIKAKFNSAVIYPYNDTEVKISAGWLIKQIALPEGHNDKVGLYKNQTLIIVNKGNAKGEEIFDYSQKILETVEENFGITLEREVVVI